MKVNFLRKPTDYELIPQDEFVIEKVVTIKPRLFETFLHEPLDDYGFIYENRDIMWCDSKDVYHCIFVTSDEHDFGILIESEGYSYARFTACLPKILIKS